MNRYQRMLNKASDQALQNHIMSVKLKYRDKWLANGTPMNHPIHIAYELEFRNPNYRQIRKNIRKNYKNLDDLKIYRRIIKDNSILNCNSN